MLSGSSLLMWHSQRHDDDDDGDGDGDDDDDDDVLGLIAVITNVSYRADQ